MADHAKPKLSLPRLPYPANLVPRMGPRAGVRIPLGSFADGIVRFADLTADGIRPDCDVEIFWNDRGFWLCDLAESGRVTVRASPPLQGAAPVRLNAPAVFEVDGVEFLFEQAGPAPPPADAYLGVPPAFVVTPRGDRVRLARTTTIGRHPESHVQILDAQISRRHAVIVYDEAEGFLLRHMSSNATMVNGGVVGESGVLLRSGDAIKLGQTVLRFEIDRSPPSDKPPGTIPYGS